MGCYKTEGPDTGAILWENMIRLILPSQNWNGAYCTHKRIAEDWWLGINL